MTDANDEHVHPATRPQWRDWLVANHATSSGVWLVSWRRDTGRPAIGYEEAVEEGLCFGWVDSQQKPWDDGRTALRFTPRKPGSPWARTNKERVARLEAAGLMSAAGLLSVAAARRDGSWTIFDSVDEMIIPDDLFTALAAHPPARERFAGFPPGAQRAALRWIVLAKRPATRAARILQIAEGAQNNRRVAP
jgi:uncharacterized protein YdeI (YjbR/CyaY-like superfamily)